MPEYRSRWSELTAQNKYALYPGEPWRERCEHVINDVTRDLVPDDARHSLIDHMEAFRFMPGGRYIYYGGRKARFWNNCFLLGAEEDTREEWARLFSAAASCLMTGGGIGVDYTRFRPEGAPLGRTGGVASGPIPMMEAVNEIGRRVMQGGSRRSAIYGTLNWQHADIDQFLRAKDWHLQDIRKGFTVWDAKQLDFNYPAQLDMTNISPSYDDHLLARMARGEYPTTFTFNVEQALRTGEPGFSFNFGPKVDETLRNACTEVTSADDSDVCNLASINLANVDSLEEFREIVALVSQFLVCGTVRAQLPYEKVYQVREKNRRLGLGLMGVHEWLLKRGYRYEVVPELHRWMEVYESVSESSANGLCDRLGFNHPVAYRAVAPTGTIGIVAGTTTGIEPLFASAYKRKYLKGKEWQEEVVVDDVAKTLIEDFALDPEKIETSLSLAEDPERRIRFQADIQDYVDQGISSTINLPKWGSDHNNQDSVAKYVKLIAEYAPRLRGLTMYPDGGRGGQPLTPIPYADALASDQGKSKVTDICSLTKVGSCGD